MINPKFFNSLHNKLKDNCNISLTNLSNLSKQLHSITGADELDLKSLNLIKDELELCSISFNCNNNDESLLNAYNLCSDDINYKIDYRNSITPLKLLFLNDKLIAQATDWSLRSAIPFTENHVIPLAILKEVIINRDWQFDMNLLRFKFLDNSDGKTFERILHFKIESYSREFKEYIINKFDNNQNNSKSMQIIFLKELMKSSIILNNLKILFSKLRKIYHFSLSLETRDYLESFKTMDEWLNSDFVFY